MGTEADAEPEADFADFNKIAGLESALSDPARSKVSSIYSYDTCDKVWRDIEALRSGNAIFTQPTGVIKCGGGESPL